MAPHVRWLSIGLLAGALAALTPACSPAPLKCTTGCADSASNSCKPGNEVTYCGSSGVKCQSCSLGQICSLGSCVFNTSMGGGTATTNGGGSAGGSTTGGGSNGGGSNGGGNTGGGSVTGGGSGGGNSCADGCFQGATCLRNGNNETAGNCGIGGINCQDCAGTGQICNTSTHTCANQPSGGGAAGGGSAGGGAAGGGSACGGCRTTNSVCVSASVSATSVQSCGLNGVTCAICGSNQLCSNGSCYTPIVDAGTGRLGEGCVNDSDCHLPAATGLAAFCKKTMAGPNPLPYQGGYCTRRCIDDSVCGAGNVCIYIGGILGETENICFKGCAASSNCMSQGDTNHIARTNYECTDFFAQPGDPSICIPTDTSGGSILDLGVSDAGPNAFLPTNANCTSNTQCGPGPYFQCLPETIDGGATGFIGGSCTGDCSLRGGYTSGDAFCGGGASTCLPFLAQDTSGHGNFVTWECEQTCTVGGSYSADGGQGGCKRGQICVDYFGGICRNDCRFPGTTCSSGNLCSPFTGQCVAPCTLSSCPPADGGTPAQTCNSFTHFCEAAGDCRVAGNSCTVGVCNSLSGLCQ